MSTPDSFQLKAANTFQYKHLVSPQSHQEWQTGREGAIRQRCSFCLLYKPFASVSPSGKGGQGWRLEMSSLESLLLLLESKTSRRVRGAPPGCGARRLQAGASPRRPSALKVWHPPKAMHESRGAGQVQHGRWPRQDLLGLPRTCPAAAQSSRPKPRALRAARTALPRPGTRTRQEDSAPEGAGQSFARGVTRTFGGPAQGVARGGFPACRIT